MTYLLDVPGASSSPASAVAVAWAIPRRVGTAVARNRVRRRLRAIVADMHDAQPLPAGSYVFHVDPPAADLSYLALTDQTRELLAAVRSSGTSVTS